MLRALIIMIMIKFRYLLDIVRQGMILEDVEHYHLIYDQVHADEAWEVVEVLDRFKVPAENGYRDLKIRVRLKENGHVATLRFVFSALLESQFDALPLDEKIAKIEVVTKPVVSAAYVITFDNFNYQEPEGRTLISGFPDTESARTYAAMRINDNLSKIDGDIPKEKLNRWLLFGEAVTIGTIDGDELPEALGAAQSAITYVNDPLGTEMTRP